MHVQTCIFSILVFTFVGLPGQHLQLNLAFKVIQNLCTVYRLKSLHRKQEGTVFKHYFRMPPPPPQKRQLLGMK